MSQQGPHFSPHSKAKVNYESTNLRKCLTSGISDVAIAFAHSEKTRLKKMIMIIIGRAKRAPWGVQSRFRVIYICVSVVCQITWNHVNQTRACSKSVLGGKIRPVTPVLFISTIR